MALQDRLYVVDARTGAIMRVTNGMQSLAPPNPPTQRATDVAAKGIGHSQYSGDVPLDTTQHQDGTFALVDLTRASAYNPFLHDGYYDVYGNQILDADGNPIHAIGLQTLSETHEGTANDFTWNASYWWFDGNPSNSWGDSQQFVMYPYGGETSVNGQTAAVDAHFGMATTWDFYKNVFNRDGIDNQGTSPISVVHTVAPFSGYYYDNAFWDDYSFGMYYSDGTLYPGVDPYTGLPTTPNPNGFTSLTTLDIIGHEMTHGVTANTAGLIDEGESGGLNEGSSDILGKMVEVYRTRPAGQDTLIPLTGTSWLVGHQVRASGLRSMIRPSSDGLSADNWYSGIEYLDVHYANGPINRFFYYLSQGAPSTSADIAYSPYLPGGMTGIGTSVHARAHRLQDADGIPGTRQHLRDGAPRRDQCRDRSLRRRFARGRGRQERVRGHQRWQRDRSAARVERHVPGAPGRYAARYLWRQPVRPHADRGDDDHGQTERRGQEHDRHRRRLEARQCPRRVQQSRIPPRRRDGHGRWALEPGQQLGHARHDGGEQGRSARIRRRGGVGG